MRTNDYVIVLADDQPESREATAMLLNAKGFTVHACANGREALDACIAHRPAVVLLDLDMPVMNGYEAARKLRDDTRFAETRVIALTGHSDAQSSAEAWDAGFHDFLPKPVAVSILLAMVRPTREMQGIVASAADTNGQLVTAAATSGPSASDVAEAPAEPEPV